MNELKIGTIIVLLATVSMCGCGSAQAGTVGKIVGGLDQDGDYKVDFCNDGCQGYAKPEELKVVEDQQLGEELYSTATSFKYATL